MTLLDLCSYLSLGAVGATAMNLLLGILMSLRYSPVRYWPLRRINVFTLHQWTAYIAVFLTLTYPVVLLFLRTPRFRLTDVLFPIHSYLQPKINLAGAAALYLLILVFISSLLRTWLGRPIWRNLHYLVFPAAALLLFHSILTDPNLKDGHPDLLDGGKVFVEIVTLLSLVAVTTRIRLRGRGFRSGNQSRLFRNLRPASGIKAFMWPLCWLRSYFGSKGPTLHPGGTCDLDTGLSHWSHRRFARHDGPDSGMLERRRRLVALRRHAFELLEPSAQKAERAHPSLFLKTQLPPSAASSS